jgi:large subunit ribosomal protein L5
MAAKRSESKPASGKDKPAEAPAAKGGAAAGAKAKGGGSKGGEAKATAGQGGAAKGAAAGAGEAQPGGAPQAAAAKGRAPASEAKAAPAKKGAAASAAGAPRSAAAPAPAAGYVPRLKQRYREEVVPKLKREFGIENAMAVPRLERISLNMGMGEAIQNIKILDDAVEEMAALAGQHPTVTRAQKSIAAFKLRAGMPIGCRVTLRGQRMWEFLDRFISVALPRVRDFRGVSPKSFDGRGNYTMGIRDHLIFLEIDYNKVERPKGMNVTIVTTAGNDERALYLLRELGMPFAR